MSQVGVKEPQIRAGQAFTHFGEAHRELEKFAIETLKQLRPVCPLIFECTRFYLLCFSWMMFDFKDIKLSKYN